MRIFSGVAGAHGKHLKIKNCGKILKFTSQIKRSAPREWEGQMRSIGGGAFPRQGKCERSEAGGESEANGVIYVIPEFVFYFCTGNKTS